MKKQVINCEALTRNPDNPKSHGASDGQKGFQDFPIGVCSQNLGLSSTDEDSPQKEEASAQQWLNSVFDGIWALSKDFPIYTEIPDWMLPTPVRSTATEHLQDSPGHCGRSAKEIVPGYIPEGKPNFQDGTWMTFHIRIPQTIRGRVFPPTSHRLSSGGNIHGQTDTATDTNNHPCIGGKCDENPPHGNI